MSRISSATTTPVPEALARLAELVRTGQFAAARRESRKMLEHTDPHTLGLITRCAEALQADRHEATAALDQLWLAGDPADAAIITACMPARDYAPDLPTPEPEPAWRRETRWVRPRNLRVRRGPATGPTRAGGDDGVTNRYLADREAPTPAEIDARDRKQGLIGYELDYDRTAVPALRGTPCVHCWIERSSADQHRGGWDDGLCGECRDRGIAGIPALPPGHSRTAAIKARCRHIADADTTGQGALPTLRSEYRRANRADKSVIAAWVEAHQR
jgi:hypothetical protein